MGLFRPYERKESGATSDQISTLTPKGQKAAEKAAAKQAREAAPQAEPAPPAVTEKTQVARKSTPTRSRRQAEAERMERLHPTLTPKEQRKAAAKARQEQRLEALDRVENSKERTLARNYVDSRWTINEFLFPIMILVMALSMATMSNVALSSYILGSVWVLIAAGVIQGYIMWRGLKKLLLQRHPNAILKGLALYMFSRSIMIRRFRQPGPAIKRGDPV